jgi:hypothetical protein
LSATQTQLPSLAVAHSGQEDLALLSAWPSQNLRELVSEANDVFWSALRYQDWAVDVNAWTVVNLPLGR